MRTRRQLQAHPHRRSRADRRTVPSKATQTLLDHASYGRPPGTTTHGVLDLSDLDRRAIEVGGITPVAGYPGWPAGLRQRRRHAVANRINHAVTKTRTPSTNAGPNTARPPGTLHLRPDRPTCLGSSKPTAPSTGAPADRQARLPRQPANHPGEQRPRHQHRYYQHRDAFERSHSNLLKTEICFKLNIVRSQIGLKYWHDDVDNWPRSPRTSPWPLRSTVWCAVAAGRLDTSGSTLPAGAHPAERQAAVARPIFNRRVHRSPNSHQVDQLLSHRTGDRVRDALSAWSAAPGRATALRSPPETDHHEISAKIVWWVSPAAKGTAALRSLSA